MADFDWVPKTSLSWVSMFSTFTIGFEAAELLEASSGAEVKWQQSSERFIFISPSKGFPCDRTSASCACRIYHSISCRSLHGKQDIPHVLVQNCDAWKYRYGEKQCLPPRGKLFEAYHDICMMKRWTVLLKYSEIKQVARCLQVRNVCKFNDDDWKNLCLECDIAMLRNISTSQVAEPRISMRNEGVLLETSSNDANIQTSINRFPRQLMYRVQQV